MFDRESILDETLLDFYPDSDDYESEEDCDSLGNPLISRSVDKQELYIENSAGHCYLDDIDRTCVKTCHYVYADGILEDKAGYDIVLYNANDGFDFNTVRKEDVVAVLSDGTKIESVLFFWGSHGLLIAKDDKEGLLRGEEMYENPPEYI